MRWLAVCLVFLFTLPVFAQDDDVVIDPDGDLTESITIGTLTVNYPVGIVATESSGQAILVLGDGSASSEDNITIATPATFEALDMDMSSAETVSEGVYGFLAGAYGDTREFADVTIETQLAGYPATAFEIIGTDTTRKTIVYVFDVDGTILAAILTTYEVSFPVNVEWMLMARIVENITIDDEPIYTPIIRPAPTESVELVESVGLYEGSLVVSVPEGWVANSSQAMVGSSEAAVLKMDEDLPELVDDELVIQFFAPERVAQVPAILINTRTVVASFLGNYPGSVAETYDGFGRNAYYVAVVSDDIPVPTGTFLIVTQLTDNPADVVAVLGIAPDIATQEATVLAILNGVEYIPADE